MIIKVKEQQSAEQSSEAGAKYATKEAKEDRRRAWTWKSRLSCSLAPKACARSEAKVSDVVYVPAPGEVRILNRAVLRIHSPVQSSKFTCAASSLGGRILAARPSGLPNRNERKHAYAESEYWSMTSSTCSMLTNINASALCLMLLLLTESHYPGDQDNRRLLAATVQLPTPLCAHHRQLALCKSRMLVSQ